MEELQDDESALGGDVMESLNGAGSGLKPTPAATYGQMSVLAAQQLGVILGVCLLVGGLFMMMIGLDIFMEWMDEQWTKHCGKKKVKDPEDPAALVGSFKRYK